MGENSKPYLFRDAQRILLLPLLAAGIGVGSYGGHVLSARIDSEIEARKVIYQQFNREVSRLERLLEKHTDRGYHPKAARDIATLKAEVRSLERSK